MNIRAVVKSIENGRITLSHKELLGTWEENVALFSAGETVAGIVRSVEPYGIFVELSPNLAGLAESREDVIPGQQASVYIKSILPARMKVKLVIIDTFDYHYRPAPQNTFMKGNISTALSIPRRAAKRRSSPILRCSPTKRFPRRSHPLGVQKLPRPFKHGYIRPFCIGNQ